MSDAPDDHEKNRLSARAMRYGKVGANVGGVAARMAVRRAFGLDPERDKDAAALAAALGGLKGPMMKVAQLLATIPEALPAEYAAELGQLQSQAPAMGWPFVRRRMSTELGPDWEGKFAEFERTAAASASLGQVHKARAHDGRRLAVKLQYPDMQSAVEADLTQLGILFSIHKRMSPAIDTSEMRTEIAARLREELDYQLEAKHMALYGRIFAGDALIRVPEVLPELSTKRLLTMTWLDGASLLDYREHPLEDRNRIAEAMFRAWWYPFSHYGIIHGDPHLGNYTVFEEDGKAAGINLLDYGCMRSFQPKFVQGVVDLYNGLLREDRDLIVHAYETWGFTGLKPEVIDVLNIWAKFIYGPMLEDRVRSIAEGASPASYGRQEAFKVHQALREKGPVKVPREFVFMDRAAIGLGGVFLHLNAELNYFRLFNAAIAGSGEAEVAARQNEAFGATGVPLP
ncbi:AarF/ABC1/UbiB kinase family protein [Methyloligella sp. 2.7D]|uniref:ABC1 kinase family protein n=1 Tax=unclassified Methyloligella TaxID=2625955 RepID=UPI00157DF69D|nr:AarF/ABC1/UbiB kinase family protein [Methyloligella sp. GL2]QKP76790.1 AarF/ABC1/UbiB kinase family protein [Methyloligella sp. GL2]